MQSHFTCEYVNTRTHTKNKMEKKGTKLFTFHLGKEELLMTLGLVFLIGSFVFICYFCCLKHALLSPPLILVNSASAFKSHLRWYFL